MKCKEELEKEAEFWLGYISDWESKHNEPAPERAQALLDNALLKLESYCPGNSQNLTFQNNKQTIHQ